MAGFEITVMMDRHLEQVLAIEHDVFADPWTRAMFAADLAADHALCLVAEDGEGVIGYVNCWLAADECTINRIACRKERQRRGTGSLLLGRVLREAVLRGANKVFLDVRASNAAAIAFYEKAGFARDGLRSQYYTDNQEDAVLMSRAIATDRI